MNGSTVCPSSQRRQSIEKKSTLRRCKFFKTGYIVPFECSPEDIVKAMEYVKNNFPELSVNARKSYEDIWAEWNFDKYYGWMVDKIAYRSWLIALSYQP